MTSKEFEEFEKELLSKLEPSPQKGFWILYPKYNVISLTELKILKARGYEWVSTCIFMNKLRVNFYKGED